MARLTEVKRGHLSEDTGTVHDVPVASAGDAREGRRDPPGRCAPARPGSRRQRFRARIVPTHEGHGVTTLELFFDLVFVFAITQVTALMAEDLGWRASLRGWSSWRCCGSSGAATRGSATRRARRRGNRAGGRDRRHGAMFLAALAIPEAWEDEGGGIRAPVVLAGAIALVRLCTCPSTPSRPWATPTCAGSCSARRSR